MTEDGSNVVPFKPKTSPPPSPATPSPHPLIFSPEILSSSLLEYLAMAKTAGLEPELAVISMVMRDAKDVTHLVSFSHPVGIPIQDIGSVLDVVARDLKDKELASVLHGLRVAKSSESTT